MSVQPGDFGGEIRLLLALSEGRVRDVACISTRPDDAGRMFLGLRPEVVTGRIGTLYSLCGRAQTIASLGAFEAALGIRITPAQQAARDFLRLAEILSQTMLKLCLGWTKALGLAPEPLPVRTCLEAEHGLEAAVMGDGWKRPGAGLGAPDAAKAAEVAATLRSAVDTLFQPGGLADQLRNALADRGLQGFGAIAGDQPIGEGALARMWNDPAIRAVRQTHGAGLAARLAASLGELRALPDRIAQEIPALAPCPDAAATGGGAGAATLITVRGPLTHTLRLADGRVAAYQITAPTEVNFAPDGPLQAALSGFAARDAAELKQAAELLVLAVDPCVGFSVEVRDA